MKRMFIMLLFLVYGCRNNVVTSVSTIDDTGCVEIKIGDNENLSCNEVIEDIDMIRLGDIPGNYIGNISEIIPFKDKFIIVDKISSKGVYLFDNRGNFICNVGAIGKGQGEYININDVTIIPEVNHIAVLDQYSGKINTYDEKGKFLKSEKTKYGIIYFRFLDKNNMASFRIARPTYENEDEGQKFNGHSLLLFNEDMEVNNYAFKDPYTSRYVPVNDKLYKMNHDVYFVPNLSNSIYSIKKDSIKKMYHIDLKGSMPDKLIQDEQYDESSYMEYNFFNGDFVNLKNYLILYPSEKGIVKTYIYDKNTPQIYTLEQSNLFPPYNNMLMTTTYFSENKIISSMSSDIIMQMKEYYKSFIKNRDKVNLDDKKIKLLEMLVNDISEESNPVLTIITLKDKIRKYED